MAKTSIRKTTLIDLTGQKFGRLTVINRSANKSGRREAVWNCSCECGNTTTVAGYRLKNGVIKSCGCLAKDTLIKRNTTHGMFHSPEYNSWRAMVARCTDVNNKSFHNYGKRGITICNKWLNSFDSFFADMGRKPDGFTLEREDNNLGYSPENCTWIAKGQQARNKRTQKSNKSGVAGIYWYASRNKWQVTIFSNGRNNHIGSFDTFDEAAEARENAEKKHWS